MFFYVSKVKCTYWCWITANKDFRNISEIVFNWALFIYLFVTASKKVPPENPKLAECVADVRALLQHILSDRLPSAQVKPSFSGISSSSSTSALVSNYLQSVLDECHETFLACYYAFYPSSQLKWRGLCDLLLTIDVVSLHRSCSIFMKTNIFSMWLLGIIIYILTVIHFQQICWKHGDFSLIIQ